jgi:hypothetical protein
MVDRGLRDCKILVRTKYHSTAQPDTLSPMNYFLDKRETFPEVSGKIVAIYIS